jgi:DNA-binding transcriptional ArsR family regulator
LNQATVVGIARQIGSFPGTDGAGEKSSSPELAAAPAGGSNSNGRREPTPSGDVCRLLSLLADKTRLRILHLLAGGERPVVSLTSELRLPQPTVSHHLAWLRMMDLVSPRRQGKHVFYALGPAVECDDGVLTLTADDATVTITPAPRK